MTMALGLVGRPPPERILPTRREEMVEFAHWLFGAAAGAAYGALIRPRVTGRWGGPVYGIAIWAAFETAIAPLLAPDQPQERSLASRLAVAGDHVLYGAIVAGAGSSAFERREAEYDVERMFREGRLTRIEQSRACLSREHVPGLPRSY